MNLVGAPVHAHHSLRKCILGESDEFTRDSILLLTNVLSPNLTSSGTDSRLIATLTIQPNSAMRGVTGFCSVAPENRWTPEQEGAHGIHRILLEDTDA